MSSQRANRCSIECSRLQAAVWALRFMRAVAKRSTAMRTAALSSKAALHRAASIRSAVPGIWTMTCWPEVALPKTADTPTMPSDPIIPTSMAEPSAMIVRIEPTPCSTKYTCSIGLETSWITCLSDREMGRSAGEKRSKSSGGKAARIRFLPV